VLPEALPETGALDTLKYIMVGGAAVIMGIVGLLIL
jgi:LPXTG-motif cell wall-anchored protein